MLLAAHESAGDVAGHRPGEQVTLAVRAAEPFDAPALVAGLDAFRDHVDAEVARHHRDGANQLGAARVGAESPHERPVDLQRLDREPMQSL